MRKLVTVVALMTLASVAMADVQMVVLEVTDANHTSRGLRAWDISLVGITDGRDNINALDVLVTGELSQCWLGGATKTAHAGSPWTFVPDAVAFDVDSHVGFDKDAPGTLAAIGPDEDSDLPGGLLETIGSYQRGMGTKLLAVVAFQPTHQPLSLDVAHVVIPADGAAHLSAELVSAEQQGYNFEVDIPEPTALVLLGIGALGTVIRRKRA